MALVEQLVRGFFEEGVNGAEYDKFDKYIHPDYQWHWGTERPSSGVGIDAFREEIRTLVDAFPDMKTEIYDLFSNGSKAAVRFKAVATHKGEWGGIQATGKPVQWVGIVIYREQDGKLAEEWSMDDSRGLFEQMGVIPVIPSPW